MGLSWNPGFLRTPQGLAMVVQVILSVVGGIVNIFSFGITIGLLGFAFWSTVIISGILTLLHVCNMAQTLEVSFPYFTKVQLGYVVIWSTLFLVAVIMSFFGFGISCIFAYLVLIAFFLDGFFKFRAYRAAMGTAPGPAAAEGGKG